MKLANVGQIFSQSLDTEFCDNQTQHLAAASRFNADGWAGGWPCSSPKIPLLFVKNAHHPEKTIFLQQAAWARGQTASLPPRQTLWAITSLNCRQTVRQFSARCFADCRHAAGCSAIHLLRTADGGYLAASHPHT